MAGAPKSRLDAVYRNLILTKFFTDGWGKPNILKKLLNFSGNVTNREKCMSLIDPNHPIHIEDVSVKGDCRIMNGYFKSPFSLILPDVMPPECVQARFQIILPKKWPTEQKPVCIHMAGTGDHYFWRRRLVMGRPLVTKYGIGSILLENPFYGSRKPKNQIRSSLKNVTDLIIMGGALILESQVLLHWCERQGYGPLALTGVSMGGHMASISAVNWPKPIILVPCLSWCSASCGFVKGVLSGSIPWLKLESQRRQNELMDLINNLDIETYDLGQQFVNSFTETTCKKPKDEKISTTYKWNNSVGISFISETLRKIFRNSSKNLNRADDEMEAHAVRFMRGVLDEVTHLKNFPKPVDPSLITVVTAHHDAYVPRDGEMDLCNDIWPGSEIRSINSGHLTAYLFHNDVFRKAIKDTFDKYNKKYALDKFSDKTDRNINTAVSSS